MSSMPLPPLDLAQPTPRQQVPPAHCIAAPPILSVVIVNYRQWAGTAQLARRILASPAGQRGLVEVVVVDNHSPRHRLIPKLRRWGGVSLRRWKQNRGFARAANEGCRLSRGDWFLLLNPDVTLPDGFLDGALQTIERLADDGRAGVVGFALRNGDGSPQCSAGPWPTLTNTLGGLLLPRARRKCRPVRSSGRCQVDWVTGCCLLLRQACWRELAGFDEEFFLYYEDVDFCRRARAAGWGVWFEPALHAVHHHPLHQRDVPTHIHLSTRHGLLTYAAKHWPAWQTRLLSAIVRAEGWCRQAVARWRGDGHTARLFGRLRALAADCAAGKRRAARRRLDRVILEVSDQAAAGAIAPRRTLSRRDSRE